VTIVRAILRGVVTAPYKSLEESRGREGGRERGRERVKEGGKDERRCNYIGRNYTRITWNIIATPAGGGMGLSQ